MYRHICTVRLIKALYGSGKNAARIEYLTRDALANVELTGVKAEEATPDPTSAEYQEAQEKMKKASYSLWALQVLLTCIESPRHASRFFFPSLLRNAFAQGASSRTLFPRRALILIDTP